MKKTFALVIAMVLILAVFAGCGNTATSSASEPASTAGSTSDAVEEAEEYVIHYPTHQIGSNSSAPANAEMVRTFNEKYAGQYRIEVEEVPGDQNYLDKMKILAAANDLPDLVYGSNLLDVVYSMGGAMSLNDALDADPEWKALFPETVLSHNSRNGDIIALPNEGQLIGYYYNTELFAQAGIEAPAKTWDEFFDICAKLKDAGITPVSMQTGDNAWCSQLVLSQMIAASGSEGFTYMNSTEKHSDYEQPFVIDSLNMLQQIWLEGYTTQDSIGGMYENAANNFISGNTAMIANGTWMIGSFTDPEMGGSEEFLEKVGVALYPGNTYISNPFDGFMICAKTEEGQAAALAMLKHWTSAETQLSNLRVAGLLPSGNIDVPDDVLESNRLLGEMLTLRQSAEPNRSLSNLLWPGVGDSMSQQLTLFATGGTTAEEVAAALTAAAEEGAKSSEAES